jgi:sarcosine oxidase, subunit alpha
VGAALGSRFGRAARDADGALVVGSAPGEWLVLSAGADSGRTEKPRARLAALEELVSVVDVTHGRALLRLTGPRAADLLAKVCAIDLADDVTPDGAALSTSTAKLVTGLVRDDMDGVPSYLLHCERSSGQYLWDALLDAGAEFGITTAG